MASDQPPWTESTARVFRHRAGGVVLTVEDGSLLVDGQTNTLEELRDLADLLAYLAAEVEP